VTDASAGALKRTALYERHVALAARTTEFGGWEMPLRYGSILEEHKAVRTAAGIFDLSHMGEVHVRGPGAAAGLSGALVNDASRLAVGRAQYSLMCHADGGVIDDLIVYRTGEEAFLVVPNASNTDVVVAQLRERLVGADADLDDATMRTSLLAIQGPRSQALLATLVDVDLASLRFYAAVYGHVDGIGALIARTGYTGEDGFELFVAWEDGPDVWDALRDAAADEPVMACGLGARDTLRLEAGMPLYGNELDRDTSPFAANLGRFVKFDGEREFIGREALLREAEAAPERVLAGLLLRAPGIARHGYRVRQGDQDVGVVTSGSHSPTLREAIAMASVRPTVAVPGTMLEVIIREAPVLAQVVPLPFYRRSS